MSETQIRENVEVRARPASWFELLAMAYIAALLGFCCGVVAGTTAAHAGGPVALTWNQASDCSSVTGWELLVAPITTSNPNPQPPSASVGVTIANTGTPPCGLAMTKTVHLSGVGAQRYWLRAVAGTARSSESNEVSASLPLAAPSGLQVAPQ